MALTRNGKIYWGPGYEYPLTTDKTAVCRRCGEILTLHADRTLSEHPIETQMLDHLRYKHTGDEDCGYDLNVHVVARAHITRPKKAV